MIWQRREKERERGTKTYSQQQENIILIDQAWAARFKTIAQA
jgi:hypothetical protein